MGLFPAQRICDKETDILTFLFNLSFAPIEAFDLTIMHSYANLWILLKHLFSVRYISRGSHKSRQLTTKQIITFYAVLKIIIITNVRFTSKIVKLHRARVKVCAEKTFHVNCTTGKCRTYHIMWMHHRKCAGNMYTANVQELWIFPGLGNVS